MHVFLFTGIVWSGVAARDELCTMHGNTQHALRAIPSTPRKLDGHGVERDYSVEHTLLSPPSLSSTTGAVRAAVCHVNDERATFARAGCKDVDEVATATAAGAVSSCVRSTR